MMKEMIRMKAKENLVVSTGGANPRPLQKSEKVAPFHTDEELAKLVGVSRDTIRKAEFHGNQHTSGLSQKSEKVQPIHTDEGIALVRNLTSPNICQKSA